MGRKRSPFADAMANDALDSMSKLIPEDVKFTLKMQAISRYNTDTIFKRWKRDWVCDRH